MAQRPGEADQEQVQPPVDDSSASQPQPRPSGRFNTFESLYYRDYRFLWAGNFLINTADWLQILTVGWLMLRLTDGNALLTGTVVGIRTLPVLIIGPWAGVLADRINRRKLMSITQICLAAVAVVFAILVASTDLNARPYAGPLQVWHLFVYVAVTGALHSMVRPVRQALIPNVVPRSSLPNAMALNATTRTSTRLLGPALGGVLIEVLGGFNWNFFLEAGAYVGVAAIMFPMRTPYQSASTALAASVWGNMKEGLAYIWKTRIILHLMLISLLPNFVFQPLVFLLPVFISDVLKGSEGLGGLLLSIMGVGGVIATMLIASVGFKLGKGRSMIIGIIVGSAAILVMAQVPWLPLTMAMFLLLGFAQTHFRVGNSTLIQTLVPDELRGRVTSVYQLDHGLIPLAVFVISLVVQFTDVALTLSVLAGGSLVIAVGFMIFAKQVRTLD
ncbi:MAG: MFS transporter [Chloroflexi bacterium]|nr:MFS transporter [Chloroflexota bacterium]MDA1218486.1 MFS transporter [Chloroflexota bacterium]PKB56881.1 MAG: hypothetical protein BZY73_06105 [SAR202 cluster bacterium Casp-Chloro-G3]